MADEKIVKKSVKMRSMEEILNDDNCKRMRRTSTDSENSVYFLRSRNVKDGFKLLDLKSIPCQADESMLNNGGFRREKTPSSVLSMESPKKPNSPSSESSDVKRKTMKMPSAAELEDFFSEAEKFEAKRFAEKYNYDIVKDKPLKGRYEWIPVKP